MHYTKPNKTALTLSLICLNIIYNFYLVREIQFAALNVGEFHNKKKRGLIESAQAFLRIWHKPGIEYCCLHRLDRIAIGYRYSQPFSTPIVSSAQFFCTRSTH